MAWCVSADIEDVLWSSAEHHLGRAAVTGSALVQAVIARSRRYTSEREELHAELSRGQRDADLAARALFFSVADAAKILIPVAELDGRGLLARTGTLRVLDVGAGVGAMSLGLMDWLRASGALPELAVHIHAVDRDARALELMGTAVRELGARWGARIDIELEHADAMRALGRVAAGHDLVLAGTMLNELGEPARAALTRAMIAATSDRGAAIIIEPALRATARALHRLRDHVREAGLAHVFAPCTRTTAPCPALADEDDWCHEDRPTTLPPRAARLGAATGLRAHGLKFAYLVLRRNPEPQIEDDGSGRVALRVVSQPKKSKGKRECFVCSDAGRVRLRLLRRHASDASADFERLERGAVLRAPAALASGGDIGTDHAITALALVPPGKVSRE